MEKYIKDGKVAVLISTGYGSGWSTCNPEYPALKYDPEIVAKVLENPEKLDVLSIYDIVERKYPNMYTGGIQNVCVKWVDIGEKFMITEYDGFESLSLLKNMPFETA